MSTNKKWQSFINLCTDNFYDRNIFKILFSLLCDQLELEFFSILLSQIIRIIIIINNKFIWNGFIFFGRQSCEWPSADHKNTINFCRVRFRMPKENLSLFIIIKRIDLNTLIKSLWPRHFQSKIVNNNNHLCIVGSPFLC